MTVKGIIVVLNVYIMYIANYFFAYSAVVHVYTDKACTDIDGQCQDDHLICSGSYYSGKCTGSTTRRCCTNNPVEIDAGYCKNLKIISRDSWGARRPVGISSVQNPVPYFFMHHTAGHECHSFTQCVHRLKAIQNYHMDDPGRQYFDIGYSFLIGQDGVVYEGRGFDREGAHTRGYNSVGIAASIMGNFMNHAPNNQSIVAVKALLECAVREGHLASDYKLYGHRDVGTTECPGDKLYAIIQTWPHYSTEQPVAG